MEDTLQALRSRLKYAHKIAAVQEDHLKTIATLQCREKQVKELIEDKVLSEQEIFAAQRETSRLVIQDQKWFVISTLCCS